MKRLIYTLLLIALVIPASAQEDDSDVVDALNALNALTPPEMIMSGPDGHGNGVVGALPSMVDVSALGGAVYSIPIKVPDGIRGLQPELSVVYNSQGGNGLLGWGWNLGGISAITRTGPTFYNDSVVSGVNFNNLDRFVLDGQRLVVLGNTGYGTNEASYRTEVDGMSKIVSYTSSGIVNGPSHFRVWTLDGRILEYGTTIGSRLEFPNGNEKEVGMWLLRKVYDRNGNYMTYQYNNDGESISLNTIYYTSTVDSSACYSVTFDYGLRDDVELSFIGNHAVKQKHLLNTIHVKLWGQELWTYDFAYETGIQTDTPDFYNRLSSVTFTCGEVRYNPTRIVWGERPETISNSYYPNCQNMYITGVNFLEQGNLDNNIKFSGDFNGDGLSDLIVVEKVNSALNTSVTRQMRVYLNEGNSKGDAVSGVANLRGTQHNLFSSPTYLYDLTNIDWLYVCDFNGDGLDDIVAFGEHRSYINLKTVTIYALKSVINNEGTWDLERVYFNNLPSTCWFDYIDALESTTLLTGDFCGRGRDDLILAYNSNNNEHFFYFTYNDATGRIVSSESVVDLKAVVYRTCDYDGDGRTEVWCAEDGQSGKIVKMDVNEYGQYTYNQIRQCFDSSCRLYTGDFNGDGKTDFLVYHPSRQTEGWEIVLGGVDDVDYCFDVSTIMNNCTGGEDPGNYSYDFETRESGVSMKYFVGAFDINGDGKTDVVVRNNTRVYFLYGPLRKEQGLAYFANAEDVVTQLIGFNGEQTYGICVGNFLGQENVSILSNRLLFSKPQLSLYYNVDSVTDGMGNRAEFEYGYLVNNPMGNDNIFTLSHQGENLDLSIYCKPLPIRAIKRVVHRNLYSTAPVSSMEYSFENALVHKHGRGFLGFAKTIVVNRLAGVAQSWTTREFSTTDMECHPLAVLKNEKTYGPAGTLVNECNYTYKEFWNSQSRRRIVFYPALKTKTVDSYDAATGSFFGRTIEKTSYTLFSKENQSSFYFQIVAPQTTVLGTDANQSVTDASLCEFQTCTDIEYVNADATNWVMGRPYSVQTTRKRLSGNDADVESLTVYQYDSTNPFLVSQSTFYPGADENNTNGLATRSCYQYDEVGNVTRKTLCALNNSVDARATEYEYKRYQLPKKERNALGHETTTDYNYYWELKKVTDCNGLVTNYWYVDHLGSTNHVQRPDGTYSCSAKRWAYDASGHLVSHAPEHAAYYTWCRSTDEPPVIVFYDASGRELRKVTEDMNGVAIYRDIEYDTFGNVRKQWEPYYGNLQRLYGTEFKYDFCQRLDTTRYPDGTFETIHYASAQGGSTVTTDFHTTNGVLRTASKQANVMGWTTQSTDNSGATVYYYYYPDGKLKKAGLDPDVTVQMQYDDAGNRTDILDPDYGHKQSAYNVFGELMTSTTPKGDVIEYRMDVLGRIVKRYDRDLTNNTVDSTVWVYGNTNGEKGLLKSVVFNGGVHAITYFYDALCRPVTVGDARMGGRPYQTNYGYDTNTGRVNQITYPTGYVVRREYLNGRLYKIKDAQNNVLWQTLRENAYGQIVSYQTGNLVHDSLTYHDMTHLLLRQYAKKGSTIIQNFTYTYDDFHNLASRTEWKYATPMTETFKYDQLDRLDTVLFNNTVSRMAYDSYGRMLTKTSGGNVVFSNAYYNDQSKPHAVRDAEINGDLFACAPQTIDYTIYDKVKRIEQGDDVLTIDYGCDRQRIGMDEWTESLQATTSKLYVGNCEYIRGVDRRRQLTYLTGPMGVFAVYEELGPSFKGGSDDDGGRDDDDGGSSAALYYLHRDHLGSVTTVTNASGAIVQELSYDAWGNLRNPYTWSGSFTGTPKFDRGYTGHEHLWRYGLINMNGRVYDPMMSCFLSVDTYVQDPENPQNFNRYAYCLNNPLRYVDPSGDFLTWSINQHGFSIGVNFTPAGVPLGFGINVSWANGGSVGLYAEAAYRVGGSGGGAGVGAQIAFDYCFATGGSCTASVFGYASLGPFSLGGSIGRNLTTGTNFWGVNAGVGLFYGSNMNAYYGGGLSVGYGSGGWSFGVNGFYDRMQKPYIVSRETANANPDNVAACHQLEGSNDCVKEVLTWFELVKGGSLTDEEIQACIEFFTIEDYKKGKCVIEEIGSIKDLNSLSNYGREKNMTLGYLDKEIMDYYGMCQQLFDAIDNGGFVMVNCESAIGHAVGVERITHTIRSNLWGNIISEYSFRVMNPAPVHYGGGYRPLSGYDIWFARNVGWLNIR